MQEIINLREWPIERVLDILLEDKTTKQNIILATDAYSDSGYHIDAKTQLTRGLLLGMDPHVIQPRVAKAASEQAERTKSHAEVFTPSWLCNTMNNHLDEEWFGRKDVFNTENKEDHSWVATEGKIEFPDGKTWRDYIDSKRLEITCGEAPYIVSRYDTTTGEFIPIPQRIGLLDRKLRIVNEYTNAKRCEMQLHYDVRGILHGSLVGTAVRSAVKENCRYHCLEFMADGRFIWDNSIRSSDR